MKKITVFALCASALTACGGGGSGSGTADAGIGGIYTGQFTDEVTNTPYKLVALIDEQGNARFVLSDITGGIDALIAPTAVISSSSTDGSFSTAVDEFELNDTPLDNGTGLDTGSIAGTLNSDHSIVATFTNSTAGKGDILLDFDDIDYNGPVPLASLAGNYTFSYKLAGQTYTVSATVNSTGSITGNAPSGSTTCSYSGTLTVPDSAFNAYDATLSSSCISGGTLSGLAAYFPVTASTAATIDLAVSNAANAIAVLMTATAATTN